jgi:hypothetical protein
MKAATLLTAILLTAALTAQADFSYTTTRTTTGGAIASVAGAANDTSPSKYYFKGQKMKVDSGATATILDFGAQTLTTVSNSLKTVTVQNFSDIPTAGRQSDVTAKIDVKETGQKKTINGFSASELVMTIEIDSSQMGQASKTQVGKMQMEMDMWLSPDVPGAGELRTFYQKNAAKFPWAALSGGGNQGMQAGMAELQRKIAEMNGVQVLQVVKVKSAGGAAAPAMPQMSAEQSAKMKDAMAQLEALQKQGGPAAAAAAQAMARMGSMGGGTAPAGAASGSLMEITMESTDFSTSSIPESVFAIPAGYTTRGK